MDGVLLTVRLGRPAITRTVVPEMQLNELVACTE
jgi:hypothetical protein